MFTLVLSIICYNYILAADAGKPAVIDLEKYTAVEGCHSKYRTIIEGELLFIRVYNTYQMISCNDLQNRRIQFSGSESAQNGYYHVIVDRVPNYGNKWICGLRDSKTNISIQCEVIFHLRTIQPTVQLYINKKHVEAATDRENRSIREYDAVAHYSYLEDEGVIIDCRGPNDLGLVNVKHYDKSGRYALPSTVMLAKQATIILKLTKEYNGSFVDCLYTERDVSKTRLYFHLPDSPKNTITVHINGIKIRTIPNNIYHHVHMYNEGERTQITCQIRNDHNLILYWYYKGQWTNKKSSQIVNETLLNNDDYESTFICAAVIDNVNKYSKESVTINFVKSQNDFYVTGLFNGNILKQYQESNNSIIMYYQYTDGEQLGLTCTKLHTGFNRPSVEFRVKGNYVAATVHKGNEKELRIYHVFKLEATQNNTNIKCICHDNNRETSIIVRLLLKKPVIASPDNDNGNIDTGNNDTGNNDTGNNYTRNNDNVKITISKNDNSKSDNETNYNENNNSLNDINVFTTKQWVFLSVGIGTLIIIFIIICMVIRSIINKKQSSESNYINVLSRVDPLPSPSNKSRQEHVYQNRMDMNHDGQIEPVLVYAEIMPTNNEAKYTKKYAPEYAQILPKGNENKKENDYENIGHSARYENGNVDDVFAEPTYSQVISER